MFALAMGIITANAQENVTVETTNGSEQPTLTKEVYPQKEADGDLYHGLSRKLTFDRMIPPHGLEVTYDKTVHVIFPAEVRYVDLGSPDLIGFGITIPKCSIFRTYPGRWKMCCHRRIRPGGLKSFWGRDRSEKRHFSISLSKASGI